MQAIRWLVKQTDKRNNTRDISQDTQNNTKLTHLIANNANTINKPSNRQEGMLKQIE